MEESTNTIRHANRRTLLLALAAFVLPVAIAGILHTTGWYTSAGTSNRGTLINPPVPFESLLQASIQPPAIPQDALNKTWWIVYIMPQNCDQSCTNSLFQIRQIQAALGPEKKRVTPLLITTGIIPSHYQSLLDTEFRQLQQFQVDKTKLAEAFQLHSKTPFQPAGKLYLVDTMGAIFMVYPSYFDEKESVLKGRDILKDLQRVLKLSKIG